MARRNGEPVKQTCPDINLIISTLTSMVRDMDDCGDADDKDDLLAQISDWKSEIESIGVGKWCELETLRNSNSSLRDWGWEMHNDAEAMEAQRDEWENKCADLEDKVRELESVVEELEEQIEELTKILNDR